MHVTTKSRAQLWALSLAFSTSDQESKVTPEGGLSQKHTLVLNQKHTYGKENNE